ncbi:hypothetical protein COLO4_23735 [Corchorus olitorius]|uniref:non-specific serine/threonine protein kinase n=1 Tax=Corchorus olitorius TaxID=93759 RepID=A0A1R3IEY6_9ROSI|nr:hypothetical protein COLO4_23735 [Corchorus olitorius]
MDSNHPNTGPALSPILEHEKDEIKTLIHSLMLSASPCIQSRLSEVLAVIGKHHFPKSCPSKGLTPKRFFWRPFQPLSLAKHIKALLVERLCGEPKVGLLSEDSGSKPEEALDKSFGFGNNFKAKYKLVKKLGRGAMGHVFSGRGRKDKLKDQPVAVKIIPKAKMKTSFCIEEVQREVKILKALSGHKHLLKFYEACEDENNVYIVTELYEGGDLWDRILPRGGMCSEEEAKAIVKQILSVVSFCHLQGIMHRDLKPENMLFTSGGEDAEIKLIDFGASDIIRQDLWSIGVITYHLLGGDWPFWAPTRSGTFELVRRSDPNFDDEPWPSVSPEAKDFVKRLLNKSEHKRMTAAGALAHRWLQDESHPVIPLDYLIYRLVNLYLHSNPLRCAAQKALSKAITEDQLIYLKAQFQLLEPNRDGSVSLENFKMALARNTTDIMDESWVSNIPSAMGSLADGKMYFEELCSAAIHIRHLEADEGWEQIVSTAFAHFEQQGNRVISHQEFCQVYIYIYVQSWILEGLKLFHPSKIVSETLMAS